MLCLFPNKKKSSPFSFLFLFWPNDFFVFFFEVRQQTFHVLAIIIKFNFAETNFLEVLQAAANLLEAPQEHLQQCGKF